MSVETLTGLLEYVVAQPKGLLQLRAGFAPVLVLNKSPKELPEGPMTASQIDAIVQLFLGSDGAENGETDLISGTYPLEGVGQLDYRIRTRENAKAIAIRLSGRSPMQPGTTTRLRHVEDLDISSIHALLRDVVKLRASDLVVTTQGESSVRHGTELMPIPNTAFTNIDIEESLGDLLTDHKRKILKEEGSLDLALELDLSNQSEKKQRFRVNVFHHIHGLAAAYRPIWETIPTFEDLNLPDVMKDLGNFPYGLVLLTGPTGAGKSTTLCSILELVNQRRHCHMITLEDPIEFVFSRKKSLIHQREVGVHVSNFSQGLRAALRENPDIILVGEMRDKDTVAAAITAAETGHLVLSTLHCGNAAQAIDRIIDIFPEHQQSQVRVQLADCLRAIVTQKLLPVMGNSDRVPAVEVLRINTAVSNMIRERKTHMLTSAMQTGKEAGMIPFDDSLVALFKARKISAETAIKAASEPNSIRSRLGIE